MTPKHIDAVRKLIASDHHVTYDAIETSLNISRTRVNSILCDHLKVEKLRSHLISHNLSQAEKEAQLKWCLKGLNKFKPDDSKRSKMFLLHIITAS